MANFFRTSTQTTPLQQAIEKATDANQPTEDWALIMKICDHVGAREDSAKEALKVIRKRLQTNPVTNGWRTIGLTLTLLEALVKNCGKIFHVQVAHKDFLKELKAVIGPKNNPPPAVQEQVLGMIQTWALAFRDDPDLKTTEQFYQECIQQGLEFPPADPEATIKAAVPATGTLERPPTVSRSMSQPAPGTFSRPNRSSSDGQAYANVSDQTTIRAMTAEQIAKLRSELDVVQTNAQVFGEMLVTLQPGEENPQDLELLMELHKTCAQMQTRIIELLTQVAIDDVTVDLLRYNDELNNSFKTFESYMQERERRVGPVQPIAFNRTASPPRATTQPVSPAKKIPSSTRTGDNEPALIKFDEEPATLATGFQNMHVSPSSPTKTAQQQSTASHVAAAARPATSPKNKIHDPERDVKEVEQWLKFQGDTSDNEDQQRPTSGTTTAFENFLQKRASTIPEAPVSEQQIYINMQEQPASPPKKTPAPSAYSEQDNSHL